MSDLWSLERRLWIDGIEAYEELMTADCIMVFGPVGILQGAEIVESLKQAPRWSDVAMTKRAEKTPAEGIAVLAYHARARRDGGDDYAALCTSTYVLKDGGWRIAQHQQTSV